MNHFLEINHLSKTEILDIIDLAMMYKQARKKDAIPQVLHGKSVALFFELPSTRTRVSFENAMTMLGGRTIYLKPGEIHIPPRESMQDTAKVLSLLSDGIVVRSWYHQTLLDIASTATVPVFNGLTDYNHPSQALADVMTMMEHIDKPLEEIQLSFVGDRTNVCKSLYFIALKLNMSFTQIAPKKYQMKKQVLEEGKHWNPTSTSTILLTDAMTKIKGSDVVYTDLWWWIDQEHERDIRKAVFYPKYQVNQETLSKTKNPNVKFMHCLPANRGMEVTSDVLDGAHSLAFHQTENRLYIQMALLSHYLYRQKKLPTKETLVEMEESICAKLKGMMT